MAARAAEHADGGIGRNVDIASKTRLQDSDLSDHRHVTASEGWGLEH